MSEEAEFRHPWLIHLQRRAAHCRRLAGCATSPGIADELVQLAESYENEALALLAAPAQG